MTSAPRPTPAELLSAAKLIASKGVKVLRLAYPKDDGSCSCGRPEHRVTAGTEKSSCGKHPNLGKGWQQQATTDPEVIERWWAEEPQSNVGLVCSIESGVFGVDIDSPAGEQEVTRIFGGMLPKTWTFTTGNGWRMLFRVPKGLRPKTESIPDAEGKEAVRFQCGLNAQTVAPPSLHFSGRRYEWADGHCPATCELLEMPPELIAVTCPPEPDTPPPSSPRPTPRPPVGSGEWSVEQRAIAYLAKCPPAVSGQGGHDDCFWVVRAIVYGFDLGPELGYEILAEHYSPRCLPPWSEKELRHKVDDAHTKPFGRPRGWLRDEQNPGQTPARWKFRTRVAAERQGQGQPQRPTPAPSADRGQGGEPPTTSPASPPAGDPLPGAVDPCTDLANGRRFAGEHREHARYSHPERCWYSWDGRRWRQDDSGAVVRMAKETASRLLAEAADELRESVGDPPRAANANRLMKWAVGSQQANRVENMLKMAQSEPGMAVIPSRFDADAWLLNCTNGTVDLRTGTLRPHDREDLLTALCPTAFDPDAACPAFVKFLLSVFNDDIDMVAFVNRLLGYALTGDTSVAVLPLFWGDGSNGKSTLVETVFRVMGSDYAGKAAPDLLMASKGDRHPTEVAALKGKRLIVAMETAEGRRLNEPLIKELTGGDRLTARRMREDFWEFDPTHKLFLGTNHKPVVKTGGHGLWRRLRLLPFTVRFWRADEGESGPDHLKADRTLKDKLAAETAGILAWMVRGCLDWQQHGRDLATPEKVVAATSEYRTEEDLFSRFFEARCERHPTASVGAGDLYIAFVGWCDQEQERPLSRKAVGNRLRQLGMAAHKSNGLVKYTGLRLRWKPEGGTGCGSWGRPGAADSVGSTTKSASDTPSIFPEGEQPAGKGSIRADEGSNEGESQVKRFTHARDTDNPTFTSDSPSILPNVPDPKSPPSGGSVASDSDQFFELLQRAGRKWSQVVEWLNEHHAANLSKTVGFFDVKLIHRQMAADWLSRGVRP